MHAKRILPPLFLLLGGLVSAAGAVGAVENDSKVRHQLEVETSEGKVRVRLTIENHGDTTVYVPREVAAEDELTGRRFDLREVQGDKVVDYTGMMVKRGALTAADFQAVAPHTMHMNTIDITPSYAFRKGPGEYELRYDGLYLVELTQLDTPSHSPAAPIRFRFTLR